MQTKLPFTPLIFLISFAAVNSALFTPALPNITQFFAISENTAQQTISFFLVGYAIGQLFYGPLSNRFGKKPTIYMGISLQILSSLLCVLAGYLHLYWLLILGRFLVAIGSGVGLKITFTLVNECYEPKIATQKIAYLLLAFAITPGISVALGGLLTHYFNWQSCFYAGAIYGLLMFFLTKEIPETQKVLHVDALQIKNLIREYRNQIKNMPLILGGLLMGCSTCFIYIFFAIGPFIAMKWLGMTSAEYGIANIIPTLGLGMGCIGSAEFSKKNSNITGIKLGIILTLLANLLLMLTTLLHLIPIISLFLFMMFNFIGSAFIMSNASIVAMLNVSDKSYASAMMNFINLGLATIMVLSLGFFKVTPLLLPTIYLIICLSMIVIVNFLIRRHNNSRTNSCKTAI